MNLQKIFPTEKSRNEAVENFTRLKDNQDWVFLVDKIIKTDIEDLSQRLLDPKENWKPGEQKHWKRIRAYWIILSQLPEKLVEALKENEPDVFLELDPYFRTVKEIEKSKRKKKKR